LTGAFEEAVKITFSSPAFPVGLNWTFEGATRVIAGFGSIGMATGAVAVEPSTEIEAIIETALVAETFASWKVIASLKVGFCFDPSAIAGTVHVTV